MKMKGILLSLMFMANGLWANSSFVGDSVFLKPCNNANPMQVKIVDGEDRLAKLLDETSKTLIPYIDSSGEGKKVIVTFTIDTLGNPNDIVVWTFSQKIKDDFKRLFQTLKYAPLINSNCEKIKLSIRQPYVFKKAGE